MTYVFNRSVVERLITSQYYKSKTIKNQNEKKKIQTENEELNKSNRSDTITILTVGFVFDVFFF